MDFTAFPRRSYLQGPTPLEPMRNLSKALGGQVNLWIKRDDLLPGTSGGNKTRKLEFCIAEALAQGADTLVTCGAVQSNHCRLTLSWAAKEGMDCHFVLEERVPGSYKPEASGNNFLFHLLGIKSVRVVPGGSNMMEEMQKTAADLTGQGKKPFIIPGGASNSTGALGYAACGEEMVQQFNEQRLRVSHIVVPSGSAGTHAGMVVGINGVNAGIPIIGMNVSRTKEVQEELVFKLASETAAKLNLRGGVARESVECFGDYVGPGYSLPTESMKEAVELFARNEAILLDPVYSGKAAAGLIDFVRKGKFKPGSNVVFLHTGGSPALYAYEQVFV